MLKVLYIEAGTNGGGSFHSLNQHLNLYKDEIEQHILCFNHTRFNEDWLRQGYCVNIINDSIYTLGSGSLAARKMQSLVFRLPYLFYYKIILRLIHKPTVDFIRDYVRVNEIDIVYLNNQIERDLVFVVALSNLKVKVISHLRSTRGRGLTDNMLKFLNYRVAIFIANSKNTHQYWQNMGISSGKLMLVYNFIEGKKLNTVSRKVSEPLLVLGTLANFSEAKGHNFLIESLAPLIEQSKNFRLKLAGTGVLKSSIEKKVDDLDLNNFISFLGYVDNESFFNSIDLLIIPSKLESFGKVALEAMSYGIPVISTDCGGLTEIIENEKNGLVIKFGDSAALVRAIHRLVEDKVERERMVVNGYLTLNRFNTDTYKSAMNKIIFS